MNPTFTKFVESLEPKFIQLTESKSFKFDELHLQEVLPKEGVYLFTENGIDLYVGRSNSIRKRLQAHCRPGSTGNQAAFAFLLTRKQSGMLKASYKPEASRKHLMTQEVFRSIFETQKARLRAMDIRVVEESDPHRQALLEMYVAIVLRTPYNFFNNH